MFRDRSRRLVFEKTYVALSVVFSGNCRSTLIAACAVRGDSNTGDVLRVVCVWAKAASD